MVFKLEHAERVDLARFLAGKLARIYGDELLYIGVYGSVARGEDKEFSDLEIIAVAKSHLPTKLFIYKDIVVLIHFVEYDEAVKALGDPDDPWWFGWVGTLLYAEKLYGSEDIPRKFKDIVNSIPDEYYRKAAAKRLVWMMEFLNQLRNAYIEKDLYSAITSALYFRNVTGEFVALLNRRHFRSHVFRSLEEVKSFEKIPKNFFRLMEELGISCDLETIYKAAEELWRNILKLSEDEGISIKTYSTYDEIEL